MVFCLVKELKAKYSPVLIKDIEWLPASAVNAACNWTLLPCLRILCIAFVRSAVYLCMDPSLIQLFESFLSSILHSERRFTFRSRIDLTRSNVPSDFSSRPLSKTAFGHCGEEIPPPSSESFHTQAFNSLRTKNGRYLNRYIFQRSGWEL